MQYIQGNLWDFHHYGPVCITTNGIIKKNGELVMGAGIALQAKQRFPTLPRKLGNAVKVYGNCTLYLPEERLFSFPTKHDWCDPSDINLIASSALQLVQLTNTPALGITQVFLPKPGCANGQLSWSKVNAVISGVLDDRFTVVMQ
jgi:hypothetical protein